MNMIKNKLQTFSPMTAQALFDRLEEPEKIDIRKATEDRLQWMAHNKFRTESGQNVSVIQEVKRLCDIEHFNFDHSKWHGADKLV